MITIPAHKKTGIFTTIFVTLDNFLLLMGYPFCSPTPQEEEKNMLPSVYTYLKSNRSRRDLHSFLPEFRHDVKSGDKSKKKCLIYRGAHERRMFLLSTS